MCPEVDDGRYTTQVGWRDIPHLSREAKRELRASTPPHLRGARERGEPVLGRGRIYDIDIEELTYPPFKLPTSWPRVYAMDTGWQRTAALWAAIDRESDTIYLYSEYYQGKKPPMLHAQSILTRGDWVPGLIDPSARGRSQSDGEVLMEQYQGEGLTLTPANNAVDAGIEAVYGRMAGGRLKVAASLTHFKFEYGIYRRDEKGKIVKANDHLMDCMRYIELSGLEVARTMAEVKRRAWRGSGVVADATAGF